MKKCKLVFVTQNTAPFRMKWLNQLALYFDIIVYHLDDYHESVNKKFLTYSPENVTVKADYKMKFGKKFFILKHILDEKPDILMLDGYGFVGQMKLIVSLRIRNIPFIISVDGGIVEHGEKFTKRTVKTFLMNSARAFFSTSDVTDGFILRYLTKERKIYRHYFSSLYKNDIHIVSKKEKSLAKERIGLKDKFVVIAVGRFIPLKGYDILIRSAEHFDSDTCLLIVGGTPTREYLDLINDRNRSKVRFIDFLDKESLGEYYCASDVFVTATHSDVWGLVIGEAMAYGLPIVSSKHCVAAVSMVREGENGFIVTKNSPESFCQKIQLLKDNPELCRRIAANNIEKVIPYTIEETVENDLENLNDYLAGLSKESYNRRS